MIRSQSEVLYEMACKLMPGGVSSPVRAFPPYPFYASHATGSSIVDVDGKAYIDYCMGFGPLILGHNPREVIQAVMDQLQRGFLYGTPIENEIRLAELISEAYPAAEMIRFVNTGTEATMHALRAARAHTKARIIIKFEGCYHGAHDQLLAKAGSGAAALTLPSSEGIPQDMMRNTLVLPYNDITALEDALEKHQGEIASAIIEPVIGNSGVILPKPGYLQSLRKLTAQHNIVLIFDEIITGFRLAYGGACERFKVKPDMVTLGKVLGGGFPIAAFAGRKEIMEQIAPLGRVYQAGTFSGNPISTTASLATLEVLRKQKNIIYEDMERKCELISKGLLDALHDTHHQGCLNHIGSMFQVFFTAKPVFDFTTASKSDRALFQRFCTFMLKHGVFMPQSQFETCFLSRAHTMRHVKKTIETASEALKTIE